MADKKYMITREHCKSFIRGICSQCGGELEPLETVDNSGNPTFWCGCMKCQRFDNGVSQQVYDIAKSLVTEHFYVYYKHMESPHNRPEDKAYKDYWEESQIGGASGLVDKILTMAKAHKKDAHD